MQLFLLVTGDQERLERWKNDLMSYKIDWNYNDGKTQKVIKQRISVRKLEFLEIAYPENGHSKVLSLIQPKDRHPELKKFGFAIRKALKLDKISPKVEEVPPDEDFNRDYIRIVPIGQKKDKKHPVTGWEMI